MDRLHHGMLAQLVTRSSTDQTSFKLSTSGNLQICKSNVRTALNCANFENVGNVAFMKQMSETTSNDVKWTPIS